MKYVPMFTIRLLHPFYRQGLCPDFTVAATPETQRLLSNHRCVLKSNSFGLDVWLPGTQQQPFIPFSSGKPFDFELRLNNPEFALFTSDTLSFTDNQGIKLFQNGHDIKETPFSVSSVRQPLLNLLIEPDFKQIPFLRSTIEITFASKKLYWACYLIADKNNAGDITLNIADSNTEWQKTQPTDNDDIYSGLKKQYPKNDIVRFISPMPIHCAETGNKNLQLKKSGNLVMENLPCPRFRNRVVLQEAGNTLDAIYSIVKYCSKPTT